MFSSFPPPGPTFYRQVCSALASCAKSVWPCYGRRKVSWYSRSVSSASINQYQEILLFLRKRRASGTVHFMVFDELVALSFINNRSTSFVESDDIFGCSPENITPPISWQLTMSLSPSREQAQVTESPTWWLLLSVLAALSPPLSRFIR